MELEIIVFFITFYVYSQKIEDSSVLSLNLEFTNKRTKFKITASMQKESPQQEVKNLIQFISFVPQ